MSARQHHFSFAKKLIPAETFRAPDRMFAELTGPRREAFLFFLWTESGKGMAEALPHVGPAPGGLELAKLDVVGHIRSGDTEVVVLSMPPALEPNEAMYLAVVRRGGAPSVFFYERCADPGGGGAHPKEAVLAETRPDGSRSNYGFHEGLDLQTFKAQLERILEISLAGLEDSLAPVTAASFVAGGGGKPRTIPPRTLPPRTVPPGTIPPRAGGPAHGGLLETLLVVRVVVPLVMFALAYTVPTLAFTLGPAIGLLSTVLSMVIGVALLVFLYKVYESRPNQTPFGPGMAVAGWLIPGANLFLPPLIVRGAYKAVVGPGAGLLVALWWLSWLLLMSFEVLRGLGMQMSRISGESEWHLSFASGGGFSLPGPAADVLMFIRSGPGALLLTLAGYGLLWYLVRSIRAKL